MPIGSLAANGDPIIEVIVVGAFGQPTTFSCVIDTGFTGFLSIPLLQAFPIGLILAGTMDVTLANGVTEPKLFCLGQAKIGQDEKWGIILIENKSKQTLLGMAFLKEFGYKLLVCPTTGQVEVVPTADPFTVPAATVTAVPPAPPAPSAPGTPS